MNVKTRFAPSPTGKMHIGGLRTALFNKLYAMKFGGQFFLRVEDTDHSRNDTSVIKPIFDGMQWLGLHWDGEVAFQSSNAKRHLNVAQELLNKRHAYYCICSKKNDTQRSNTEKKCPCSKMQDKIILSAESNVIRLNMPDTGTSSFHDQIHGVVEINNSELSDIIIVRSDGGCTYPLAVVVDDHDMQITHVIRGNDHLTNTFVQLKIYEFMNWDKPNFAHLSLIGDESGKKLSKRQAAADLAEYISAGLLPEAVMNFLLNIGWIDDVANIMTIEEAANKLEFSALSATQLSCMDTKKLEKINAICMHAASNDRLAKLVANYIPEFIIKNDTNYDFLEAAVAKLKKRHSNLKTLSEEIILVNPWVQSPINENATILLSENSYIVNSLYNEFKKVSIWNDEELVKTIDQIKDSLQCKKAELFKTLRAKLTGVCESIPVVDAMYLLGREESLKRLQN